MAGRPVSIVRYSSSHLCFWFVSRAILAVCLASAIASLVVASSWSTVVDTALFREGDPVRTVKAYENGVRNAIKDLTKGIKSMRTAVRLAVAKLLAASS
jgi:hypothetical protein